MTLKTLIPLIFLATASAASAQETSGEQPAEQSAEQAQAEAEVEAAATNATLAMQICLQNYRAPEALLGAFEQAGFAHTTEDFGDGNVLHWFATPDDNLTTAVAVEGTSVECRIGTGLWGVEAMLPFAQEAVAALTQGVEVQTGSPEGQNILPGTAEAQADACSGFHVLLPQTMLWVQILRQGNDGTCISDGTSVMRMIF